MLLQPDRDREMSNTEQFVMLLTRKKSLSGQWP